MRTVLQNLQDASEKIITLLEELKQHSSIRKRLSNTDSSLVIIGADNSWNELDTAGRQIQSKCLEEYSRFHDILSVLLCKQPDDTLRELDDSNQYVLSPIQQNAPTWDNSTQKPFSSAIKALKKEVDLLNRLYDISEEEVILVPDTNALLYNPFLELWSFDDFSKFTVLLTSTVLSELDYLKINHRNEDIRKKSERLISQIKEYRRRGKLTEGVNLVSNRSRIIAVATEPQMDESLSWFDSNNNDDRILAGLIEIMRLRPSSPVLLVTRDINLQNKAEFANIIFIEPPDIT